MTDELELELEELPPDPDAVGLIPYIVLDPLEELRLSHRALALLEDRPQDLELELEVELEEGP